MTTNSRIKVNQSQKQFDLNPVAPKTGNYQTASVPISIYRQLSGELEAAKTQIDALKRENEQLWEQNQYLNQELTQIVDSAQHLKQMVLNFDLGINTQGSSGYGVRHESVTSHQSPVTNYQLPINPQPSIPDIQSPIPNPQPSIPNPHTESSLILSSQSESSQLAAIQPEIVTSQDHNLHQSIKSEDSSRMNTWLLTIAIMLIVFTAFGTGFMIVRPLLQHNNGK